MRGEAIDELSPTSDLALLSSMGIYIPCDSDRDYSAEQDTEDHTSVALPADTLLRQGLEAMKYNRFEVVQHIERDTSTCMIESTFLTASLSRMFTHI